MVTPADDEPVSVEGADIRQGVHNSGIRQTTTPHPTPEPEPAPTLVPPSLALLPPVGLIAVAAAGALAGPTYALTLTLVLLCLAGTWLALVAGSPKMFVLAFAAPAALLVVVAFTLGIRAIDDGHAGARMRAATATAHSTASPRKTSKVIPTKTAQTRVASTARLSTSLAGADLSGTDLRGAHLESVDLAGTNFSRSCLAGAHLEGATLAGANFLGADVSGVQVDPRQRSQAVHWPSRAPHHSPCAR